MINSRSKISSKHNSKKGNNSTETSDDSDHSRSGRGSSNSSESFSDSGNSSTGQNPSAINNLSPNTSIGGIALNPGAENFQITKFGISILRIECVPKYCNKILIHFLVGPVSLNYGYLPFPCYRRMTPEEDLLATQQGIDLLVKQRQALVDKLVIHHNQLSRTNEKESLLQFSRQIDSIMRYVSYI